MKGKCAMQNRIVAFIVATTSLFAIPFTTIPASAVSNKAPVHEPVVAYENPKIIVAKIINYEKQMDYHQRLTVFVAKVREYEQQRVANEAAAASRKRESVTQSSSSGMPAEWAHTAMCEEGGRNDPYAGYFGILEWNHFEGYPTAGSAPLSVQLAWEAKYIGGPPDKPGECHSY
jgi:hypothetical protein